MKDGYPNIKAQALFHRRNYFITLLTL